MRRADPVSAFGGVVALTRRSIEGGSREALISIFLEIVVAPGFSPEALAVSPAGSRTCEWSSMSASRTSGVSDPAVTRPDPTGSIRTAGRAVLVTVPDSRPDDPAAWRPSRRD